MAITPVATETTYNLVGSALGPFATVFPYAEQTDVLVYLNYGGSNTILLETPGDYTQADTGGDPLANGGTVTLSADLLVGGIWPGRSTMSMVRATPRGQPSELGETDLFSPDVVEAALDNLGRQIQDVDARVDRALLSGPGEPPPQLDGPSTNNFEATAMAAATVMDIVSVGSRVIHVTGQTTLDVNGAPAPITDLGPCDAVTTQPITLVFDQFNMFNCDGVKLVSGQHQFFQVQPNSRVECLCIAEGIWQVEPSFGSQMPYKAGYVDQEDTLHVEATQFGSPNFFNAVLPDFRFSGSDNVPKLHTTAIFIGCATNTPQLGFYNAAGTPNSMTPAAAGSFSHVFCSTLGSDGSFDGTVFGNCLNDLAGMNHNQTFDYSDRSIQLMFGSYNAPTPTDRSGYWALGICAPGQVSPIVQEFTLGDGGSWQTGIAGRSTAINQWNYTTQAEVAAEYPITWADNGTRGLASGPGRRGLSPGGFNPPEMSSQGNYNIFCAPKASFAVFNFMTDRKNLEGFYLAYDNTNNRLQFAGKHLGSPTYGVAINQTGDLEPASDGSNSLGLAGRRFGAVYAESEVISRDSNGTVTQALANATGFSSDLYYGNVVNSAAGTGFNLMRLLVQGSAVFRIDGTGKAFANGGLSLGGAGFGEPWRWADGNPQGEDRSGWTVAAVGRGVMVRASDRPDLAVMGVISRRVAVLADPGATHGHGRWKTDRWGRVITRPVEHVRWTEARSETVRAYRPHTPNEPVIVSRPVKEVVRSSRPVERVEERDGKHVLVVGEHGHQEERAVTRPAPLHGEDGQPLTRAITRHEPDAAGRLVPVMGPDGKPIVDQVPVMAHVPVMEDVEHFPTEHRYEDAEAPLPPRHHSYRLREVPKGLEIPPDAERFMVDEPQLNHAHDPNVPKGLDHPAADPVSYLGMEIILKGERTDPRWIALGDVDDAAEEWLLR